MKTPPEPNRLLDDVLAESAPGTFRETLLNQTLEQVRHRKQRQRATRIALPLLLLAAIPLLLLERSETRRNGGALPIASQQPSPGDRSSPPKPLVEIVRTSSASVEFIESKPAEALVEELNDDELLTMLADTPALLVRHGPGDVELVFAQSASNPDIPIE